MFELDIKIDMDIYSTVLLKVSVLHLQILNCQLVSYTKQHWIFMKRVYGSRAGIQCYFHGQPR